MESIKGVLNTDLTKTSNTYVLNRSKLNVGQLYVERIEINRMYSELFEQLLLFDKVSIILGSMDNSAIASLIVGIGPALLERALALETIEITLPSTLSFVGMGRDGQGQNDPSLLFGTPPVLHGKTNGEGSFGDKKEVVLEALRFVEGYSQFEKQEIARRISPYIKLGPVEDGDKANKIIMSAYESDSLSTVGMPFTGTAYSLNATSRIRFQKLVSEVEQMLFVAENNYGLYNTPLTYNIAKRAVGNIEDALHIQKSNDILLSNIRLPNLRELYLSGKANFSTAMNLRERRENIAFRKWIPDISDPKEREYVLRNYVEAVSKPVGFSETTPGQLLKGTAMYGLGKIVGPAATALGGIVAGPVGAVVGGIIGAAAEPIASGIIEITGNYFLDKVAGAMYKGWTPKHFVDQVQTIAEGNPINLKKLGL